ncbi:MAG: hypothetical protein ACRC9X_05250 [Bacteroidales bacterium]
MRKIYEIDLYKLLRMLLSAALRQSASVVAILESIYAPLLRTYSSFINYGDVTASRLTYGSQTCRLRAMLNDLYDSSERRIRVENKRLASYTRIYRVEEAIPIVIADAGGSPLMINRLDATGLEAGFNVLVPSSLFSDRQKTAQIRESIEQYRLATRYFSIISL